ncbi:uncharacterized protein IL334_000944 [Kwoniella shivajii]|uniref:FAD/NAD(P)-binding domain-containing protein n=1 Tax=Kwoniella shivajii TaxID=564305 RepID=A0ABZ1CUT5_9TREE|nr:hypothetical protein IL334_000944 [Kwoniella shivajii]
MVQQEEYENIIIIGASIGGHECANSLVPYLPGNYRILLIDARSFAWWPITILRAVVIPGWENKVSIPLTTERVFKKGSQHHVIAPNKVTQLNENSVILRHPFEGSNELPFFRCIIATGASQPLPTMPGWDQTEGEFMKSLQVTQKDIAKSKKVVVIGGGAVGVEIAGEIASYHPHTKVTLIHKDYGLLSPTPTPVSPASVVSNDGEIHSHSWSSPPTDPRLSTELQNICKKLDINVILSDRVMIPSSSTPSGNEAVQSKEVSSEWNGSFGFQESVKILKLKSGSTIEADYIYPGCGMKPNSGLVRDADQDALDDDLIRVDDYLKVTTSSQKSMFRGQYYAIGDACSSPGLKVARGAIWSAHKTANNVINEIRNRSLSKYKPGLISLNLPLGPDEGAGMVSFGWLGTWVFGSTMTTRVRGKTSGTERFFAGRFKGEVKSEIRFDDLK